MMDTQGQTSGSVGQPAPTSPTGQVVADPKAATTQVTTPSGQADTGKAPNLEGADTWEYDGNMSAVPPQFQKFAKGLQRHFTQKSMTEAEIRRKGQEYDQFVGSDEFKSFQTWRSQQRGGQPIQGEQPAAPANPTLISQQEWEDAQLDPSGQKAQGLIERVVSARLNAAVKQYGGQLQQLQQAQEQTRFDNALSSFADTNPDVLELHATGLMKPLLKEEMASGKHKTYESAINAAYKRSSEARDGIKAALMAEQQKLVAQKKDAIVMNSSSVGSSDVVYVDKNDAFSTAFDNALAGKKVKNRLK